MKSAVGIICCALFVSAWGAARLNRGGTPLREVCYDNYGCFASDTPWTSLLRPLASLPKPPYEVQTRFLLFTRNGDPEGYELMPGKDAILHFSDFKATRKTVVLIHGFTDNHKARWMAKTKNNLLLQDDYNVLAVDWSPGAKAPYLQAVGNARLVGAQGAAMISYLESKGGLNIADVHVIGHSLGGQIAAYVSDRLMSRIPHITALDPAEPYFGGTDRMVRLDNSDAVYVDVIHSNANGDLNMGLGMIDSVGHADFFPNGGKQQPGCKDLLGTVLVSIIAFITWDFEGALEPWACSHYRAADFFAESVLNNCPFVAHSCSNYNEFNKGNCYSTCSEQGKCHSLGFGARNFRSAGNFYLHTGDGSNSNYCLQTMRVDAPVALSQSTTSGTVTIAFRHSDGTKTSTSTIIDGRVSAGQLLNTWVEAPSHIVSSFTEKPTIVLRYTRGLLQGRTVVLDSISLNVIDENLQIQTLRYGGVTLETGVDVQISS